MNRNAQVTRRAFTSACAVCSPFALVRRLQAGVFGGIATEWTQLMNHAQLVSGYIRQGEELRQKILMVMDMVRNTAELPFQLFAPIMRDLDQLKGIVQGGRALAYSMANLDAEFLDRFRGYGYEARAWWRDYRDWSQTSLDSTLGTLRAAGLQSQQMASEEQVLRQLRQMARTSNGRMKALQVANQILEQQVQQLMKLRQLILADLQSKQAFQAAQIQKEAGAQAAEERLFQRGAVGADPRRY